MSNQTDTNVGVSLVIVVFLAFAVLFVVYVSVSLVSDDVKRSNDGKARIAATMGDCPPPGSTLRRVTG